jgi:hypothetical protein
MRLGVILGLAIVASLHAFAQTRTVETGDFFFRDGYSRTSETVIDVGTAGDLEMGGRYPHHDLSSEPMGCAYQYQQSHLHLYL